METAAFPGTGERGFGERVIDGVRGVGRLLGNALSFIAALLALPFRVIHFAFSETIGRAIGQVIGRLSRADRAWVTMIFGAVALVLLVPETYGALTDPILQSVTACSILFYIDQQVYNEVDTYDELRKTAYGQVALLGIYGWIIARCFGG